MKIFLLLVAFGLGVSTLTGICMALNYTRPLIVIGLQLAGIIVPCVLLGF